VCCICWLVVGWWECLVSEVYGWFVPLFTGVYASCIAFASFPIALESFHICILGVERGLCFWLGLHALCLESQASVCMVSSVDSCSSWGCLVSQAIDMVCGVMYKSLSVLYRY